MIAEVFFLEIMIILWYAAKALFILTVLSHRVLKIYFSIKIFKINNIIILTSSSKASVRKLTFKIGSGEF